ILDADLIVLGPGDLYTSVLANCVVDGVSDAIKHSTAKVVYVSNLMTRCGQTSNMGVAEHVAEISRYIERHPDYVIVNTAPFPAELIKRYEEDGECPVVFNYESNTSVIIPGDFLAAEEVRTATGDVLKRSLIRHDPRKLARKLMDIL
ncbi:MAG TPA: 2-phospho-L-lactate transferase CofD family protein, partial [Candidatus Paceibacterota bacterium]